MSIYPYNAKKFSNQLEVMDAHGVPVALIDALSVRAQLLRHRVVAVAVYDVTRRLLLQRPVVSGGAGQWSLPWRAVRPGDACEDTALAILEGELHVSAGNLGPGRSVRDSALEAATGMCVTLYQSRLSAPHAIPSGKSASQRVPREYLCVDKDELHGLHSHFGDMLTPWLRSIIVQEHIRTK